MRFIESHRHKPFLAYLSFYSVHVPLSSREDLRQKFEAKRNPFGETDKPIYAFDGEIRVRMVQEHAVYAGMVKAMDQAVGKVLKKLDDLKLTESTIVVFTSDNGGLSTGDQGVSPDQGWPTSNAPLRGGKGWLYEGGIRVPTIIRAPGVTKPGSVSDQIVTSTDFYRTFLELANLPERHSQHVDSVSLVPALRGRQLGRDTIFWHYPHHGNQGGRPGGAVRQGDWKLVEWYGPHVLELFNLADDIGEQHNLAETEAARCNALSEQLAEWRESVTRLCLK